MAQLHLPHPTSVREDHAPAATEEPRAAETPRAGSPKTILVVDDQPAVGLSVAYYLEVSGYRALRAESGEAAIALLRKQPVDGVLLDVQMPGMNGFQACAQLQAVAKEAGRPVKAWFMTGIHYRELPEDCAKAGGLAVFHKPFDWPQMLAELERGFTALPPPSNPAAATWSPAPDATTS